MNSQNGISDLSAVSIDTIPEDVEGKHDYEALTRFELQSLSSLRKERAAMISELSMLINKDPGV